MSLLGLPHPVQWFSPISVQPIKGQVHRLCVGDADCGSMLRAWPAKTIFYAFIFSDLVLFLLQSSVLTPGVRGPH